jgi:hypothetical protein
LPGGADGHVADFDIIGLLDGERDGARYGVGADAECRHGTLGLLSLLGVAVVDQFGAYVSRLDGGRAQDTVGGLLA